MKIGFDISQTGKDKTGCGYFSHSLFNALLKVESKASYIAYPSFGDGYWDPDCSLSSCLDNTKKMKKRVTSGPHHTSRRDVITFWRKIHPDLDQELGHPNIIHANNFFTPRVLKHTKLVYTLHDLSFLENPEWHTEGNRVITFQGAFHASIYADGITAVSHYSRAHFLEHFPYYPPNRVWVVHEASRFPDEKLPSVSNDINFQSGKFWLSVGTLEPRKNHQRLLNAYAKLVHSKKDNIYPLVLVGAKGWRMEHLQLLIEKLNIKDHVKVLGYVEDATLQWLYKHSFAFIYPSLFEGFGLPVLEAMAMGAAVITSETTSIPEVVGDAGYLIDPLDENAIYQALLLFQENPALRNEYSRKSLKQAAKFSWEKTAQTVLSIYEKVLSLPKLHSPVIPK